VTTNENLLGSKKLGPIFWLLCFQFILVEYLVSLATTFPYSRIDNYISDLGSAHCAVLTSGFTTAVHKVCSPLHDVMNASFIIEGLLIAAGTVFMRKLYPSGKLIGTGLFLFIITGIGFVMAGLAPNDVNLPVHYTGAVMGLFGSSIGMVLIGLGMLVQKQPSTRLALYTVASGVVAIAGTVLLSSGLTLGIGVGGMERVAFYPYPVWMTLTGIYYLRRSGHDSPRG
jgi:hypothetical membrane protein